MSFVTSFTGGLGSGINVQFVDSITTTPTVRLDLNNELPFMVTKANWSPPPVRRAMSSTMLADGDLVTASRHGNRTITLELDLQSAAGADAASAALQMLGVELNRTMNILRVQLGSHTTFWRTYRAPDYVLDMLDTDGLLWDLSLTLLCEPYGYGLPVLVPGQNVGGATYSTAISSDPAYASTDQLPSRCIDVNGVIGDVETPLMVTLRPPNTQANYAMAVRRGGNPAAVGHVLQAETNLLLGPDTTLGSHDALMSGTGSNYAHTTFATASYMFERVDYLFPPSDSVDARGAYRVFAHVRRTNNSDVVQMKATYNQIDNPAVVSVPANGGSPQLVDLGVITVPTGNDPGSVGMTSTVMPVNPGVIRVQASRTGTATLDIDYLYLMPADDHFLSFALVTLAVPDNNYMVVDGYSDSIYETTLPPEPGNAQTLASSSHYITSGSVPYLSPGNNRLYLVGPVASLSSPQPDTIDQSFTVWLTYWPRYLTLATT